MVSYPIHVIVKPYIGNNKRRHLDFQSKLADARRIEKYLNQQMESCAAGEIRSFEYCDIAKVVDLPKEYVREILFAVDGGSNGITIGKSDIPPIRSSL